MTTPDAEEERLLDQRVRAAAEVPFDDVRMAEAVLARVHAARPRVSTRPPAARWIAPLAFASVLAATPFLVAGLPFSDEALILGLAAGDPGAVLGLPFAAEALTR